jgi:hypothetical protein
VLTVADALSVGFGTLSTLLALLIGFQAYRAYRFTGRKYLVNFSASFLLLGGSYYLVGFLLTPFGSPAVNPPLEWERLVLQSTAYLLLASAYFSKSGRGEEITLFSLLAVAAISVPLLNLVSPPSEVPFDEYFYLLNFLLSIYVLARASRGYVSTQQRPATFAAAGFFLLTFSQFSWVIWDTDGGSVSLLFALLFRLLGLVVLVESLVELSRTHAQ